MALAVRVDSVACPTDVLALAQLAVVQDTAGVGGLVPPDASTEAKLVIVPPDPGAVAVIVNAAVPSADTAGSAADNVTVHVRRAAVEFKFVQLTLVTPAPGVAAVAVTPAGSANNVATYPHIEDFEGTLLVSLYLRRHPSPDVFKNYLCAGDATLRVVPDRTQHRGGFELSGQWQSKEE